MRKTLAVSLCSMFLILIFSSVALADTYEIPVITNGKIITLSVEVEGGVVVSASTVARGVLVGKPVDVTKKPVVEGGYWAELMPDALSRVEKSKDEFSGNTFYTSKFTILQDDGAIYPYIGTDGDDVWIRFSVFLVSEKATMFDNCTIVADGEKFTLKFNTLDAKLDFGAGNVYESNDIGLSGKSSMKMLQAVAKAKITKIRFYGRTEIFDYVITAQEKNAFIEALATFELLGGDIDKE